MRSILGLGLLLAGVASAAACELGTIDAEHKARVRRVGLTGAERALIVTLHNRCRDSVEPPARPALPPLVWSDESAAVAQQWAGQCRFEHNPGRSLRGENIASPRAARSPR